MGKLLNKKGSIEDLVFMIVMLLGLAIGGLAITYTYDQFVEQAKNVTTFNQSQSVIYAFEGGQAVNDMWDYLVLTVLIGFAIAVVILGYFVDVHTIFFPIFLFGLIIVVFLSIALQHVWDQVSNNGMFGSLATTNFPITQHIFSNLPIYVTVIGGLSMLALYAKSRSQVGY